MSDKQQTGKCLCGKVQITVTAPHKEVGTCHCDMCRRWASGPYMAVNVGRDIEIRGEEHISAYRSSDWGERAFCSSCGSHLYYRLLETGEINISAGLLDNPDDLTLKRQIFIDEKPDFYDLANDTKKMTGAQVFAYYTSKDNKDSE
jgi:hypothetical protein